MKPICRYCDNKAIGYERDHSQCEEGEGDTNVCKGCAHYNTTVYLYNGSTYRKQYEVKE